jgi:hypothetical protein
MGADQVARPSKFTAERRARFLAALAAGSFPEPAARLAGWSPATLYRILAGRSREHRAFRAEVVRVETELELRLVGTVTQAAFSDARLALTLLERRFAERWGRAARVLRQADEGANAEPRPDEVVVLDAAFVAEIVPKLLAAGTGRADVASEVASIDRCADHGGRDES